MVPKKSPLWMALAALLILAALFAALFHHHEDGQDHPDCFFCRFAQQFICGFALLLALFAPALSEQPSSGSVYRQDFISLLLAAKIRDRAPPFRS
ncbi:MAG: hypothetical protein HY714_05745 [Candidatus Omnitrophica bacterium]|nr:hypothetical protein [Candidatus Omnitrophota bacterium]